MFVGALKATSSNTRRVMAAGIAQSRVEKIRMLGAAATPTATTGPTGYACITSANMNSSAFDTGVGPGGFSTTYPAPAGGQPYTVNTTVSTDDPTAPYKTVVVTVTRAGDSYATKVSTVIQNPAAIVVTSTSGPQGVNNPHSLTVSSTKQWQEIKNVKVTYCSTAAPTVTLTPTPATMTPNASATSMRLDQSARRPGLHVHGDGDPAITEQLVDGAHGSALPPAVQRLQEVRHEPRRIVRRAAMQTFWRRRARRQDGFTLMELLISLIIMSIVTTMLVGIWISLQGSFDFSQQDNTAATTGRTALDRVSSELRAAQPPTTAATNPFCLALTTPYVCDGYDCTFYSPYNNSKAATQTNPNGTGQSILTSIYLDTSGTTAQKKLYWVRDTNNNGVFDAGDQKILLANNVVNTAGNVNKPIFQYILHATPNASFVPANSLSSGNVAQVVAVNVEVVIDANLAHKPTYVDLVSTVRPRNVSTN